MTLAAAGRGRAALVANFPAFIAFPPLWNGSGAYRGVKTLARLLLSIALFAAAGLRADSSLPHVRHAQELLGSATWSRIIRVENSGKQSRYPRELHALVFEAAGLLWFYTPLEGTQSFSLHVGQLDREKADFGPLLRDIEPGFRRWREVKGDSVAVKRGEALPNGCFIESLVALRERVLAGEKVGNPRLLSYYMETAGGVVGHTVLAYEHSERIAIFDTAQPERRTRLFPATAATPLALARALEGPRVLRAREVKLNVSIETAVDDATVPALAGEAASTPSSATMG